MTGSRGPSRRAFHADLDGEPSCRPTRILDWGHPEVAALLRRVGPPDSDRRDWLCRAHHEVATALRPVYGIQERQPVSRTLRRGRGSCSQRLAVLEALSRAAGIPTRVEGLLVDGRFWHARAGRLRPLVPRQVVLAWPEFLLDDVWISASRLHGDLRTLAEAGAGRGFSNDTTETLFEAIGRTAVDWHGETRVQAPGCDLSALVLASLGHFPSRDALFATHGETLRAPVRTLADSLVSRWSPAVA